MYRRGDWQIICAFTKPNLLINLYLYYTTKSSKSQEKIKSENKNYFSKNSNSYRKNLDFRWCMKYNEFV